MAKIRCGEILSAGKDVEEGEYAYTKWNCTLQHFSSISWVQICDCPGAALLWGMHTAQQAWAMMSLADSPVTINWIQPKHPSTMDDIVCVILIQRDIIKWHKTQITNANNDVNDLKKSQFWAKKLDIIE
jgi:hypothetical protein